MMMGRGRAQAAAGRGPVVAAAAVVLLAFGAISTSSAQENSKLLGVYRGTCVHFDKEKLVAAVYVLTGLGGYMALYDDNGGCTHIMTDYIYNDTTLTSSLFLQADQGWSCTNVTNIVATLGPDGHQVQGRITDSKGLKSHCDLVEVIREHPTAQHRAQRRPHQQHRLERRKKDLSQQQHEQKTGKPLLQPKQPRLQAQLRHVTAQHWPASSSSSSFPASWRNRGTPVVPAAFSGRCESQRHPCHVSAQLITGPGLAQGVGYLWWWGSCNDTAYDCLYVCNGIKPIGDAATHAAASGGALASEAAATNMHFHMTLERFDNYGVAACPELKPGSQAVFSPQDGRFNITAASKHAHPSTYHVRLVPDVLP